MAAVGELTPLFTFGIIADAQYGDLDDAMLEGRRQRFREVLGKLDDAVTAFKAQEGHPVSFVLSLGDTIQGHWQEDPVTGKVTPLVGPELDASLRDLEAVARGFDKLAPNIPAYHVTGNHDLTVPRQVYEKRLGMPGPYYSVVVAPEWRLIVLDTTDVSVHSQYPPGSAQAQEAEAVQAAQPLGPEHPQMQMWNGAVGRAQMEWLDGQLRAAEAAGERVIVACHHPVAEGVGRRQHMAWNYRQLQARLLHSHSVVLVLSGHDHEGAYGCVDGVHFLVPQAMLEAPTGGNAFAFCHVYHDHLHVKGVGTVTSRKLALPDRLVQLG